MRGKLTQRQIDNVKDVRRYGVISVLEKTNRILGSQDSVVKVEYENGIPAPAMTDGKKIIINTMYEPVRGALEKGFDPSSMMIATGLNYHELAHCLFMPRITSPYIKKIREKGMFETWNILEDQTDETRFVKLYEPAKHYFSALVSNFIIGSDAFTAGSNYLLVSGRRFIPQRMRLKLMDDFSHPDLIPEIDALITEYKSLVYPDDEDRMFEVVTEFHDLIRAVRPPDMGGIFHENISVGQPKKGLSKELLEAPEPSSGEAEPNDEEQADEDDRSSEGQGEEEPEEEATGQEEEDHPGQDGDEEQEGEEAQPSGQAGEDGQDEEKSAKDVAEEILEDLVDERYKELTDRIDSVKEQSHKYRSELEPGQKTFDPVTPQMNSIVARCADEFRVFEQEKAPGWSHNQRHGKMNPRHYARALRGDDQVFKRWKEGVHDALDFEVVFLLDMSSSMNHGMNLEVRRSVRASKALWILRRAFDDCDGVVTVLGFSNDAHLLSQRFERADKAQWDVYQASGWTYIENALAEAIRILDISKKAITIIVIVTDGGFSDPQEALELMKSTDHPILLVGIEMDVSYYYEDHVMHSQNIDDPMELIDLVQKFSIKLSDEHSRRVV